MVAKPRGRLVPTRRELLHERNELLAENIKLREKVRELENLAESWAEDAGQKIHEISALMIRAEKAEAHVAELTSYIDAAISWLDGLHSNGAEALANLRKAREREVKK